MLFSVLSSKRTLSSHYLPNKSMCQKDIEVKVLKEIMEKKGQGGVAFTDHSSPGVSSGLFGLPDGDNRGTEQRYRNSAKTQLKGHVISSTVQMIWPSDSFQSPNPVAVPSRPASPWQFCSLSRCPFSSPFPWRMCFLCPCLHARSEAACPLCWSKSKDYWPSWQTWGHCL